MDIGFLVVGAIVVILTGISKSGFAGGLSVMAVPALSLFVSPLTAAAVMLPILVLIDIFSVWKYRHDWVQSIVWRIIPGAVIGIGVGALTFSLINVGVLKVGVGLLALWFALNTLLDRGAAVRETPMGRWHALFFGSLSGFTSFVAHAGGPPVKGYLLSQRLAKTPFVATNSIVFFFINQIKLVPYFLLGQFSSDNLKLSLMLAPFVPIGVLIGFAMHHRVPQQLFTRIVCVLLLFAGAKLAWDGAWIVL